MTKPITRMVTTAIMIFTFLDRLVMDDPHEELDEVNGSYESFMLSRFIGRP